MNNEPPTTNHNQLSLPDIWIKMRLYETIAKVDSALERYRFDEASEMLYQFVWHQFCDWYLELSKVERTQDTLISVFYDILCLIHPFMPFITQELFPDHEKMAFPTIDEAFLNNSENIAMARNVDERIIETVTKIRNLRGEMNIPPKEEMSLLIDTQQDLTLFLPYIKRLARIRNVTMMTDKTPPKRSAVIPTTYGVVYMLLEEPHIQKEMDRLLKVAQKLEKEMASVENRLNNPEFIKAPQEVQVKMHTAYNELKQKKRDGLDHVARLRGLLG